MNQFYSKFSELTDEWCNSPRSSKQIINCLVEFLAEDLDWLDQCISKVDRETLVSIAKRLERKEQSK